MLPDFSIFPKIRALGIACVIAVSAGTLNSPLAANEKDSFKDSFIVAGSIPPVHSLIASIMQGVETPLLLAPNSLLHENATQEIDLVIATSQTLEPDLKADGQIHWLADNPDIILYPDRGAGVWENEQNPPLTGKDRAGADPYFWLSVENGKTMAREIAGLLAEADSANAENFARNAGQMAARLSAIDTSLRTLLAPVSKENYVIFHDTLQYFEHRYDLSPTGSLVAKADQQDPSPFSVRGLVTVLRANGPERGCLFSQYGVESTLFARMAEMSGLPTQEFDPLGANLHEGPALYPTLLLQTGVRIRDCLDRKFNMDGANEAQDSIRILALGDSLTAGYGLDKRDGLVEQLKARLVAPLARQNQKVEVVDAGVSGDTTAGGRSRIGWLLGDGPYDLVLVGLGGNDGLRGLEPAAVQANLAAILETLKAEKTPALLLGMKAPPNFGESYTTDFDQIFPDLANEYGVLHYPFMLDGVAAIPSLNLPDGIHPNQEGIRIIAESLTPYVLALIQNEDR